MTINNVLLRASAGTGKTFQLSNRYILLILDGTSPETLLATTFTRKAAGEILDRIFKRLAVATTSETRANELSKELKTDPISPQRFGEALIFLSSNLHRINVSTLDSYFAKLLTNHAYELSIGADWSIATSAEQAAQNRRAIMELLGQLSVTESARLMRFINNGKCNRGILRSLEKTISNLISPFYQSPATAWASDLRSESDTQLLTDEQISSAIELITSHLENDTCSTFFKTMTKDLVSFNARDWDGALKSGLFKKIVAGEDTYNSKELPSSLIAAYRPLKQHVIALKILEIENQTQATFSVLSKYTAILEQIKRATNRLEFSDVPRLIEHGGRDFKSAFRMDGRIDHLMLDEFQDTSLPQWNIVEPLALSISQQTDASFFCVGDVKQAIYGWRGGRREIFERLETSLDHIHPDTLKDSYRSSRVLVEFVNNVFEKLDAHPNPSVHEDTLTQWQSAFVPLKPILEHDGYVEYVNAGLGDSTNERMQACLSLAVDKTEMLIAANREMDIGILVRTNESIAILIQMLAARGIASSEDGGNPLSNYSAIQTVLSALSLIEHPANSVARFHVSHSPLAKLFGYAHGDTNDNVDVSSSLHFRQKIAATGFHSVLAEIVLTLEPHVDRVQFTRLEHLLAFADTFTFSTGSRLDEFIEAVEKERFSDPEASRVRVMTIHQSKGLEFDAVILPTLESALAPRSPTYAVTRHSQSQEITDVFMYRSIQIQQLLPSRYSEACKSTLAEHVNESLCVLYVSLTRAARALYIIGPCKPKPPKVPPLTSAGIIQMSFSDEYSQIPTSVIYQNGNENWFEELPAYDTKPLDPLSTLPAPLAKESPTALTPLQSASPSSLEGGDRFQLSGVLRASSAPALLFGTQLHFFMEQIDWAEGPYWELATDTFTAKYGVVSPALQSHLEMFSENAPLSHILTTDFYFDESTSPLRGTDGSDSESIRFAVHNEYPICAAVDGTLLRGFIDRLVVMRVDNRIVAVDICDYKTDRVDPETDELKESISHYRPQIAAYRKAIAQMFALKQSQIGARLIFTSAGVQIAV
jgi:ATP-dependent helicase/nuclease subunit A